MSFESRSLLHSVRLEMQNDKKKFSNTLKIKNLFHKSKKGS